MSNLILDTDSYKASHYLQYPDEMTGLFEYFESRGGMYPETVFFGLQYILRKYLSQVVTQDHVMEAYNFFRAHGEPFNVKGWDRISKLGYIPVRIRAVHEGVSVPNHNIMMSVESTDPETFWVASWIEAMLVRLWYPCTVTTRGRFLYNKILDALRKSSDDPKSEIGFKLHDFGARGSTSKESARIGGMAHLASFMGSDNLPGVLGANKYYDHEMSGFSIPAAEHSTVTAWGRENEIDAYKRMLAEFAKPEKLVAVVSDSYDLWNAIDNYWGGELRKEVIESGATVIIRPDSGDPRIVVEETIASLDRAFGHSFNSKGYKVINNVRVIQGDGVNDESIGSIIDNTLGCGYSMTNLSFGSGSGILQEMNRDTQKMAYKASNIIIADQYKEIYKDPATDPGKASKGGRLDLVALGGGVVETRKLRWGQNSYAASVMHTVFEDGKLYNETDLEGVRSRIN